jgi:hypothetical protein
MKYFAALISILLSAGSADAETRLTNHAKIIEMIVRTSLETCTLALRASNLAYDADQMDLFSRRLDELAACRERGPAKIQPEIQKFRAALKAEGKSEVALKGYIMTYRRLMEQLGTPGRTSREAERYAGILSGKGAEMIAETEW